MKAMILAAGKGTRLRPLTDQKPKALLEVCGVPLLRHQIYYLKYYGIREIVVNVHHHADQVVEYIRSIKEPDLRIECSNEEALLDTGGGLNHARWFFDDGKPFLLITADVITDLDLSALIHYHIQHQPLVTLAVMHRPSTREFLFNGNYTLCGWHSNVTGETRMAREVKDPVKIAFSTVHVINPAIFDLFGGQEAFSLTEAYLRLAADYEIKGYEHHHSQWFEFGRIENLDVAEKEEIIRGIFSKYHV